jgi:natural product precursor
MKKLNLQLGSIKEMLTQQQMKRITGGYDCPEGQIPCTCISGNPPETIEICVTGSNPITDCWNAC